jgi:hypothetical protein
MYIKGASVSSVPSKKPSWDVIQGKQGVLKLSNPHGSPAPDEFATTPVRTFHISWIILE